MTPNEMKEARKKLNLTQKEFATKLGVKLRVVNYWEAGERNPSKTVVILLGILLRE